MKCDVSALIRNREGIIIKHLAFAMKSIIYIMYVLALNMYENAQSHRNKTNAKLNEIFISREA